MNRGPYSIPQTAATPRPARGPRDTSLVRLPQRIWHNASNRLKGSYQVGKLSRSLRLSPFILLLAACGGGNSESGGAGGSTPFIGNWFLAATLNVNVGGTATFLTDTTRVVVGASGNAVIANTDSECGLNIHIDNNILIYRTTCVFTAASGDATAPCVLTLETRAAIRGPQGSAQASSSFGPETRACSGAAVSYTGNLVARQGTGPDTTGMTGTGTGTGTDTGTGTGTGTDTATGSGG